MAMIPHQKFVLRILSNLKHLSLPTPSTRATQAARVVRSTRTLTTGYGCTSNRSSTQVVLDCHQARRSHDIDNNRQEESTVVPIYHKNELERFRNDSRFSVDPDDFDNLPPKCSSCGVIFQTQEENRIGYIIARKLEQAFKTNQLHRLNCLNCFDLKNHNKLNMPTINRKETVAELRHVRKKYALVLYVVDMFDIEGTLMKDILKLVGKRSKVIVVGNKVDRLPRSDKNPNAQMKHMKTVLKDLCLQNGLEGGKLVDVCLVSALTGYGLGSLVQSVIQNRDHNDVYVMGCANTGKSALYNLLVSSLNVDRKTEMPPPAIVHHVPGSTVRLVRTHVATRKWTELRDILKNGFPVEEPKMETEAEQRTYFDFDDEILELLGVSEGSQARKNFGVMARVEEAKDERVGEYQYRLGTSSAVQGRSYKLDPYEWKRERNEGKYLYDTPGLFNASQIIQYLTPDEINWLIPTRWIVPQTMLLKPGNCLFVGGMARLDYTDIDGSVRPYSNENGEELNEEWQESEEFSRSSRGIFVTAMISPRIPLHVTLTETADEKFQKLFSSDFLKIPHGSPERFEQFPKLEQRQYTVVGQGKNTNACDFALHGIGWLSIAAAPNSRVSVALHTPNGEGQSLRTPSLLQYTVQQKMGKKKYNGRPSGYYYDHMRRRSPQLIGMPQFQNPVIPEIQWRVKQKLLADRRLRKEAEKLEQREQGVLYSRAKRLKELEDNVKSLEESMKLPGGEEEEEMKLIGEGEDDNEDREEMELMEYEYRTGMMGMSNKRRKQKKQFQSHRRRGSHRR